MMRLDHDVIAALVAEARSAQARAYVPYSKFPVGAALLVSDGSVITGCNVENASYPLGLCAERGAVAAAVAKGYRKFLAVAIVGSGDRPLTPCGGCRQVLSEFGDLVVIAAADPEVAPRTMSLSHLLPESFGRENLT